eukprot:3088040-Prymnesium_polylepis.1
MTGDGARVARVSPSDNRPVRFQRGHSTLRQVDCCNAARQIIRHGADVTSGRMSPSDDRICDRLWRGGRGAESGGNGGDGGSEGQTTVSIVFKNVP